MITARRLRLEPLWHLLPWWVQTAPVVWLYGHFAFVRRLCDRAILVGRVRTLNARIQKLDGIIVHAAVLFTFYWDGQPGDREHFRQRLFQLVREQRQAAEIRDHLLWRLHTGDLQVRLPFR